jgi:hypothetical protein
MLAVLANHVLAMLYYYMLSFRLVLCVRGI